jgi:chemotaxis-related protein WspB
MLWLTFSIGSVRYAVDTRMVLQVVPRVALRRVPGTAAYVMGLLDQGGTVCPVVDLGMRLENRPCASRLSTRIIVAQIEHQGQPVPLGLVAEGVTDVREVEGSAPAAEPRTVSPAAVGDLLGPVVRVGDELVQWIEVSRVLSDDERDWLYARLASPTT